MLTNPNTCGLFEHDIIEIADAVHDAGGYFYCDGANFNAIVGRVRPGDLGIDAMHINLHKTFSTPARRRRPGHRPGGAVGRARALRAGALRRARRQRLRAGRSTTAGKAFGRLKGFHGQMGMFVRALAYMLSHGSDGLRQVAGDAVLNANYILAGLKDEMTPAFPGPCMHEALFDDEFLDGTGVTTLDFAKAMIDEGYHPMTMYFPLVVHGAMLIEPTETESKDGLDRFIERGEGPGQARQGRRRRLFPRRAPPHPAPPPGRNARRPPAGAALEAGGAEEGGGVGAQSGGGDGPSRRCS